MKSYTVALLVLVLAFEASAWPFGNPDLDLEWEDFKQRYNKNYELDGEEQVLCSRNPDSLSYQSFFI